MCRILSLVGLLIVACSTTYGAGQAVDASLQEGAAWLIQRQSGDGGWHSTTYGQMASGVGNTAIILDALSQLPPSIRRECEPAIERGIDFLLANLDPEGYVSAPHGSADYPLYATALVSRALDRLPADRWRKQQDRMRAYLLAAQRDSGDDPLRGGWPQVGGPLSDAHYERNVNISVSRHVVEALGGALVEHPQARAAAINFVARCQNADGAFCFLPLADDPLNKAGVDPAGKPRSYGTATADGVLTLLACGVPASDPRIRNGLRWLESHESLDRVPGFLQVQAPIVGAGDALKFYYYAALAGVMSRCRDTQLVARHRELSALVTELQRPDGSWSNSNVLMREDDPLIATALALSALAQLREVASR